MGIFVLYSSLTLLITLSVVAKKPTTDFANTLRARTKVIRLLFSIPLLLLTCTTFYLNAPMKPLSEYPVWLITLTVIAMVTTGKGNVLAKAVFLFVAVG